MNLPANGGREARGGATRQLEHTRWLVRGRTKMDTNFTLPPRASRPPFASSFWALPRTPQWVLRMTRDGCFIARYCFKRWDLRRITNMMRIVTIMSRRVTPWSSILSRPAPLRIRSIRLFVRQFLSPPPGKSSSGHPLTRSGFSHRRKSVVWVDWFRHRQSRHWSARVLLG